MAPPTMALRVNNGAAQTLLILAILFTFVLPSLGQDSIAQDSDDSSTQCPVGQLPCGEYCLRPIASSQCPGLPPSPWYHSVQLNPDCGRNTGSAPLYSSLTLYDYCETNYPTETENVREIEIDLVKTLSRIRSYRYDKSVSTRINTSTPSR